MRLTTSLFSRVAYWSKQYGNLPDRYIKRAMEQVFWKNPKGPQYRAGVEIKKKKYHFGLHRPWTHEFREDNSSMHQKVWVEPIKEWSFFRGDRVEVLAGPDKGKQGIVIMIIQERNWVLVEGLNCILKNISGKGKLPVYVQEEQPLRVTDQVALVDPSDLVKTTIEWRYTEEGDHVRVSSRTGRIIPMPTQAEETIDYKTKGTYREQPKDTIAKDASAITFEPALQTFEMDIMEKMGIKEDRVPRKTYWW